MTPSRATPWSRSCGLDRRMPADVVALAERPRGRFDAHLSGAEYVNPLPD